MSSNDCNNYQFYLGKGSTTDTTNGALFWVGDCGLKLDWTKNNKGVPLSSAANAKDYHTRLDANLNNVSRNKDNLYKHHPQNTICNNFSKDAQFLGIENKIDTWVLERALPWKDWLVRCCTGDSGGRVANSYCGKFWGPSNTEKADFCDPVMETFCKDSDTINGKTSDWKKTKCACIDAQANSALNSAAGGPEWSGPVHCLIEKCSNGTYKAYKTATMETACNINVNQAICNIYNKVTAKETVTMTDMTQNQQCGAESSGTAGPAGPAGTAGTAGTAAEEDDDDDVDTIKKAVEIGGMSQPLYIWIAIGFGILLIMGAILYML
jgi:hypothetical protein